MKLGPMEIIVILIIVGVILLVFRGMPTRKNVAPPPPPVRVRRPTAAEVEEARIQTNRRLRLRAFGGSLVVIGLIVLAGSFKMFNVLLLWYSGAALVIVAGIAILFLSARH